MKGTAKGSSRGWAAALVVAMLMSAAGAAAALAGSGSAGSTVDAARATAKYRDLVTAKGAGYGLLKDKNGVGCIAMDAMPGMGAMGVHYAKNSLVADGALKVSTPEALVYAPVGGKLRLAAVEYVVLKSAWDAKHTSSPSLFGHAFNFTPAGNRFGLPAFYSLHAWIWKHNPKGMFEMWNPTVTCR
jgi:hypothetical protein